MRGPVQWKRNTQIFRFSLPPQRSYKEILVIGGRHGNFDGGPGPGPATGPKVTAPLTGLPRIQVV